MRTIRAAIRCVRRIDDHELFCVVKKSQEPIVEKFQQAMGLVGQAMNLRPSPDLTMDGFRVESLRDSVALEQFLSSQAALNEELACLAAHSCFEQHNERCCVMLRAERCDAI